MKPVANAFLARLKNTRSILDLVSYAHLPGMLPLKDRQVVKLLVYKEFIDQTLYMLVGLDERKTESPDKDKDQTRSDSPIKEDDKNKNDADN